MATFRSQLPEVAQAGLHAAVSGEAGICLTELLSAECHESNLIGGLENPFEVSWAPKGRYVAFSGGYEADLTVASLGQDGSLEVLYKNDDGADDQLDLTGTVRDFTPTWLDEDRIALIQRPPQGLEHLAIIEVGSGQTTATIPLPTAESKFGRVITDVVPSAPLVLSENEVLVAGREGRIYSVDIPGESASMFADVFDQYPAVQGSNAYLPTLVPLGMLGPRTLVLDDRLKLNSAFGRADFEGLWSTMFGLDTETGQMQPMFDQFGPQNPVIGPLWLAVEPGGRHALMLWGHFTRPDDWFSARGVLSVIDTESMTLPLDPWRLPVVWEEDVVGRDSAVWTNHRSGLGTWTDEDVTVLTVGSEALVFQIK